MKFYKDAFLRGMVSEWSDKYVDYKGLKNQIILIKNKALTLAEAYSNIYEITGEEVSTQIDLSRVVEEEHFWEMLEGHLKKANEFYRSQVSSLLVQFDTLTKQSIRLDLISSYTPREQLFCSRLERELSRRKDMRIRINFSVDKIMMSENSPPTLVEDVPLKVLTTNSAVDIQTADLDKDAAKKVATAKMSPNKVRTSFCEFYRGLVLLESFCELNYEAIRKLVKKFDKNLGTKTQENYMQTVVGSMDFTKHATLKILISETEHVFSKAFTEGRRTKAMEELRVPTNRTLGLSVFRLGMFTGLCLPIFMMIVYTLATRSEKEFEHYESIFIVYRMLGMAILMLWCWGLDLYIWTKYRVNYVFIFEFNARSHVRYQNILEKASLVTLIWVSSVFIYVISNTEKERLEFLKAIPVQVHPFLLCLASVITIIVFQIKSKAWLLKTIGRSLIAPFVNVKFRDFFLADQLASISIVLYDLEYTICYFFSDAWTDDKKCLAANIWTRPVVAALPAFWRFMQCIRRYRDDGNYAHLLNAGKYSTVFFVSTFSVLRFNVDDDYATWWLFSVIVSSIYSNYWDVYRDWGLGDFKAKFLRKKLLYKRPAFYYFAIVSNLLLRLTWILSISPDLIYKFVPIHPASFAVLVATLEILRRAQWNLLRLENEQLHNVGRFRAFDVVVPPSDQEELKPTLIDRPKSIIKKIYNKILVFFGFKQNKAINLRESEDDFEAAKEPIARTESFQSEFSMNSRLNEVVELTSLNEDVNPTEIVKRKKGDELRVPLSAINSKNKGLKHILQEVRQATHTAPVLSESTEGLLSRDVEIPMPSPVFK
eukprot:TRINITY_DN2766_c0_g1_i2.p1 TRINITY_DN2766_c0_g1~~TRINITY_DN2766_c0_g1_i2.p1  ORF type:complete len:824 (-),score=249.76 TRINITY_DN2766_c0_g1_i2:620-3091(-)